jgi:hemerythrin
MRRDASLIPLSHQHHNGLALCVLTRRALAADTSPESIQRQSKRIIDRFELELVNHFAIEEEVLFPLCAPLPLVDELIADHRKLEEQVARLRKAPGAALLEEFCALLSSHIRREESELFEQLQRDLPRETLDRAGAEIDRRAVRICL